MLAFYNMLSIRPDQLFSGPFGPFGPFCGHFELNERRKKPVMKKSKRKKKKTEYHVLWYFKA